MIIIAVIVVLAIVQLYVSEKLDGVFDAAGMGKYKWGKKVETVEPSWPAVPIPMTTEETSAVEYVDLYSGENISGSRTRAALNDVYVFCSQRGGVKTWNFKSISAPRGQILCFFSRSVNGDSSTRFVIVNRPIRNIDSFLSMYPDITQSNTGIKLYGWEHVDLDFVVMPVVETVYRQMLVARLDACRKLGAAWKYDAAQTDAFCQFTDPIS